jgi:hypothetical protein
LQWELDEAPLLLLLLLLVVRCWRVEGRVGRGDRLLVLVVSELEVGLVDVDWLPVDGTL